MGKLLVSTKTLPNPARKIEFLTLRTSHHMLCTFKDIYVVYRAELLNDNLTFSFHSSE